MTDFGFIFPTTTLETTGEPYPLTRDVFMKAVEVVSREKIPQPPRYILHQQQADEFATEAERRGIKDPAEPLSAAHIDYVGAACVREMLAVNKAKRKLVWDVVRLEADSPEFEFRIAPAIAKLIKVWSGANISSVVVRADLSLEIRTYTEADIDKIETAFCVDVERQDSTGSYLTVVVPPPDQ